GVPARGRARPLAPPTPPEEFDEEDVFEDEAPPPAPRQRASARDYQNAYRENEEGFGEEQRRSSGPLLLMLALVAAALLVGGAIWYYGAKMKNVAGTGTTTSDSVPVVSAPEQPAKTAPEQPADGQLGDAPAVKKKQIYDRIVGEQEVIGGQVLPTEEVPVQPATAQPAAPADAAIDPAAAADQIPLPDVPALGNQILPVPGVEEPPPLPLPPPPGSDQQGSLDQQGIGNVAATAGQPEQGSTAPPAPAAIPQPSSSDVLPLPPPEIATDGAAIASADPSSTAKTAAEAAAPAAAKVISEPLVQDVAPAPAKKATKTATKKKPAPAPAKDLGTEPVVLVPPAEPAAPSQGGQAVASAPAVEQPAVSAPPKKKKTLLDIFRGSDDADSATTQSTSAPETQVAAVQPQAKAKAAPAPAPAPEQKTASVSGYLIQLSSFRSEPEARSEYGRLSQLYPTVVGGLPQRINQTKIGGSTRYQLALGPLNSRSEATRVCSALFSAGESDCIVRGP
ncbi:SPOR domain-containing protein, partial [Aestuariivirga sp.]|uniref:SPOR domain-containing protein n=1 Tax=Aestuariivirga sp. TaxID=2650926 RepID=UPI003593F7E4